MLYSAKSANESTTMQKEGKVEGLRNVRKPKGQRRRRRKGASARTYM